MKTISMFDVFCRFRYATCAAILILGLTLLNTATAQDDGPTPRTRRSATGTNTVHDYATDVVVVHDAQGDAIDQAKESLQTGEGISDRAALEAAIKQMEQAEKALADAKSSPDKLPAALAAEQAAYQALLKAAPREFRVQRQRGRNQGGGGGAAQPNSGELSQLEMSSDDSRYETERQASAQQNSRQREQLQTADRLKELAQRQQDLNDRLRELQTALQAAKTDQQREDLQHQLQRLRDDERQMLSQMDDLRQQLEQSPNANSLSDTRQRLDETRNDMERAAEQMQQQQASQALAAGTRAQQNMQNARDDLRKSTSSQFTDQMRQLRNQARDLSRQEDDIAKSLDSLANGDQQSLDTSGQRRQLLDQLNRQQNSLTNLLGQMRDVTEQAESSEPLLSQQLYDTLRRADQMRTDNVWDMSSQLVDRGFFPQAGQNEGTARTNVMQLRQGVERAAESVLGSEADSLRFAGRELDDLMRQLERDSALGGTNQFGGSNLLAGAAGLLGTNRLSDTNQMFAGGAGAGTNEMQLAQNDARAGSNAGQRTPNQRDARAANGRPARPGEQGNRPGQGGQNDQAGQNNPTDQRGNQQPGQPGQPGQSGDRQPGQPGEQQSGQAEGQAGDQQGGQSGGQQAGQPGNRQGGADDLRQFAQQLGRGGAANNGGPITGGDYLNWADRLRGVEQAVDPVDLRNQLAVVRERIGGYRSEYRLRGIVPPVDKVKQDILVPMGQVRVWIQEELARQTGSDNLVPLDRDPVPDNYADLVRQYYEKLGSAQ